MSRVIGCAFCECDIEGMHHDLDCPNHPDNVERPDAAPVEWPMWLDPKDDPLVLRNMAKVGYTFDEADCDFLLNLAKNIELDFATHPDAAPPPPDATPSRERVKCKGCGVWHFPEDPCPEHAGDYVAAPPFVDPEAVRFASMCYANGPDMSAEGITRNIVEAYLRCVVPPSDAAPQSVYCPECGCNLLAEGDEDLRLQAAIRCFGL